MILIVDDSDDARHVLALLLKLEGFQTCEAGSGPEALRLLRERRAHCVILDYNMPDMDGLEVLREIRADVALASIRVIMFSAMGHGLAERALAAGADGYVEKTSLDFGELRRLLLEHCRPSANPTPLDPPPTNANRDAG